MSNKLKTNKMKKLFLAFVVIAGISISVKAQDAPKKDKVEGQKTEEKAHVCTDACHKDGHCTFAHGEKGHACTDACKTMTKSPGQADMKEHACTDACKTSGEHQYAHGEKGHVCGEACMKKK